MESKATVLIWDWDQCDPGTADFVAFLSANELLKYTKFKSKKRSKEFISGRMLLKKAANLLSCHIDWNSDYLKINDQGKPHLQGNLFFFNISHSHEVTVLGFHKNKSVGVDVEYVDGERDYMGIAEHYFSKEEFYSLRQVNKELERRQMFFQLWTLKEAFLKYQGLGLSNQLSEINMLPFVGVQSSQKNINQTNVSCRQISRNQCVLSCFGAAGISWQTMNVSDQIGKDFLE